MEVVQYGTLTSDAWREEGAVSDGVLSVCQCHTSEVSSRIYLPQKVSIIMSYFWWYIACMWY